jgi:chromate transporter
MVFSEWKELPAVEAAFRGIRPAVVALIAAPLVKLAKNAMGLKGERREAKGESGKSIVKRGLPLMISLAAALLIWLGHVNPVWVILATIILTLASVAISRKARG